MCIFNGELSVLNFYRFDAVQGSKSEACVWLYSLPCLASVCICFVEIYGRQANFEPKTGKIMGLITIDTATLYEYYLNTQRNRRCECANCGDIVGILSHGLNLILHCTTYVVMPERSDRTPEIESFAEPNYASKL